MTDAEYDSAIEQLRALQPHHPFLTKIGAPTQAGDEVTLPVPLPSLNKLKSGDGSLAKWLAAPTQISATHFHISQKLDGCSALWIPDQRRLYTRGDGTHGRDISSFASLFQGCIHNAKTAGLWVRGELIMRNDTTAVPAGKLARNIVAGALNRKAEEVDTALFNEIHFVAYELVKSPVPHISWSEDFKIMRRAGFETAITSRRKKEDITEELLTEIFGFAEYNACYQLDGIVISPDSPHIKDHLAKNPVNRVAWKNRPTALSATTTVESVEWNISPSGILIPRVLFNPPVVLSGATISAATGIHAAWIRDNIVGPGAVVEIRRAGDVIPQITAVLQAAPGGAALPTTAFVWESVHIRPTDNTHDNYISIRRISHALNELGAENVGPGIVARLFAAGFKTVGSIYAASEADILAAKPEGIKEVGAKRIWQGLRCAGPPWKEIQLMKASCVFPRGVGSGRLEPLLEIDSNPATWSVAKLVAANPSGISRKMIEDIVAAVPAYLSWKSTNFPSDPVVVVSTTPSITAKAPVVQGTILSVVLTGFRNKAFEAELTAAGHHTSDNITKQTTHLIIPDGPQPKTAKVTTALTKGIPVISFSEFRTKYGF